MNMEVRYEPVYDTYQVKLGGFLAAELSSRFVETMFSEPYFDGMGFREKFVKLLRLELLGVNIG